MVDFRRWITALAGLALFTGLASAQVVGSSPLQCTASVAVPPQLRAEGMTELIGDIVLNCTGGTALTAGSVIPTANITVSLATNVTSRLLGTGGASNSSEALLLIDEPGSGLPGLVPGSGPTAPQTLCSSAAVGAGVGGCVEYVQNAAVTGGTIPVASSSATTIAAPANVFQGLVVGNQVTFNGVPILAPVTSGAARIFRITNVRANVSGLGGGGLNGTTVLNANIAISGSTALPVNNPVQVAGFIQAGLSTSVKNAAGTGTLNATTGQNFNQCTTQNTTGLSVLGYTENFGTAFKTRVAPTATTNGQFGGAVQNIPGTIYNSESGFIFPTLGANGFVAGLADYGTRLKAVFNNIPAGASLFVSTTNVQSSTTNASIAANANSFAVLINGEASPDSNNQAPVLTSTGTTNGGATTIYQLPIVGGSATAVWEVINTNPNQLETLNFAVYISYTANPGNNSPAIGTGTVNLSYAPTPTVPFSATAGSSASGTLLIPRFADTSSPKGLVNIVICQTLLLFPFVTNNNGFDTGLAIANTSSDPVGTAPQGGNCTLTWYDGSGKPGPTAPFNVATATVHVDLVSNLAPAFTGYMMALCNFQYAHGFAFISDLGARNLAMGYLALVVNNGSVARPNAPPAESLGN